MVTDMVNIRKAFDHVDHPLLLKKLAICKCGYNVIRLI